MPLLADSATLLTGAGAIALLSLSISYSLASARRARSEYRALRAEHAACNWRQTVLVETMHVAQIPVPSWIWAEPPADMTKLSTEQQRSMAQRMIDPYGDEPDDDDEPST